MECNIPHKNMKLTITEKKRQNEHHNNQAANEHHLYIDNNITCPLLTIGPNCQIQRNEACGDFINYNLKKFETELTPVFLPSPVKCGRGPVPKNLSNPKAHVLQVFNTHLKLECKKILKTEKYRSLTKIKSKLKEGEIRKFGSLTRAFKQYGDVQTHPRSLAGGNLGKILIDSDEFLVHTNIKPECMLCFTRLTLDQNTIATYPSESNFTSSLDGGTIYQVATPNYEHSDGNGVVFATRQLHATVLWHLKSNGGEQPILENIHEKQDSSSVITCVDVNPIIKGEFCELRQNNYFSISRRRGLIYGKKLDRQYNCCIYADHPQNVLLAGNKTVDLLDARVNGSPRLLFSTKNEKLGTFYNVSDEEVISCLAPSTKIHVYFAATDKSLLTLDHRMNSRPLLKTTHSLDQSPMYISSACQGDNMEWVFLSSQAPDVSSVAVAMSWNDQGMTGASSSVSLPVPNIVMKPQARSSLRHTLDRLHFNGQGLDWAVQNRFRQNLTGMVCHKSSDVIRSWVCTAAGDVFTQRMNLNDVEANRVVDNSSASWISQWTSCVKEIERDSVSIVATELYSSSDVTEQMFSPNKDINGIRPDVNSKPAIGEPECLQKFAELTEYPDERGKKYIESWFPNAEPNASVVESNFTQDFDLSLFTSTPYHKNKGPFLNLTDYTSLLDA